MKKYLKITLITFALLIVVLSSVLFTQPGNDLLKPYLKAQLEKEIGQPVEVQHFKLRYDHTEIKLLINKALNIEAQSIFNLLTQNFDGTYTIYANNFVYDGITLKEANINGVFKGTPMDVLVNGKGTSFEAPLNYYLRLLNGDAEEITIQLKEMALADILTLAKQPAIAKGKVDANITIPTLVKDKMNAHGKINLHGVTFNDTLMKEHYKIEIPKALVLNSHVDTNVTETQVTGNVDMLTNLADVHLSKLHFNRKDKALSSAYIVDVIDLKNIASLLRTKVEGPLKLQGHIKKDDHLRITGKTTSLGGQIDYRLQDKRLTSNIKAVPIQNMLKMFHFPAFMNAQGFGEINYNLGTRTGEVNLDLEAFKLASNKVTKSLKMVIQKDPASITFGETSFDAKIDGFETTYKLVARSHKASITVDEATIHHGKDSHMANIEFAYDKYAIDGSIGGSIRNPNVAFNTKGLMPDRDILTRIEKEIRRFLERLF
jgi:hypothetical protein